MPHPIHWDDVPERRIDQGELRSRRRRLGAAAGAARVGLSRHQIDPGGRSTPAHVHADEEEIFFVLAGAGLSWQDGETYEIGAGDCLVHRIGERAHTLVAGPEGLDALAFGEGSETNITRIDRTNSFWLGSHWLPGDGPNPFRLEADAAPLPMPEAPSPRPDTIVALADVKVEEVHVRRAHVWAADLAEAAGSRRSGLNHLRLAPGAEGWPPHMHSAEEELFVVLEGDGVLRLDAGPRAYPGSVTGEFAVRPGHVIARPPGSRVAHSFLAGESGLTLLAYGARDTNDIVLYPRSRKISFRGVGVIGRLEQLDYWDGEG